MECKGDKWDCKERGSGNIFRRRKFELLVLTEEKLKGNGAVSWCKVNGIVGVQEIERARECVAVLMSSEWYSAVIDFGCVALGYYGLSSSFQR